MINYAVGHYSDVDGVLSHALLERASIVSRQRTVHLDIDYKDMLAPLKEIDLGQAEVVRIFDLGHNKVWESPEFIEELRRIANTASLEIYDHHKWPNSSQVYGIGARRIILPRKTDNLEKKCTSEIVEFFFTPNDQTAGLLSQIANNSDFTADSSYQELNDYTRQLELVVAAADKRVTTLNSADLVNYFATLPSHLDFTRTKLLETSLFWPKIFNEARVDYNSAVQSAKQSLEGTINVVEIQTTKGKYRTAIGFSPQILHMKEGVKHLQQTYPSLSVYACVYEDSSIIFSRDTKEIDLSLLGEAFNGGGRQAGAGGFIPKEWKSRHSQEEIAHMIIEKIREVI